MRCSSGIGDSPTYVLWIVIVALLLMLSTHYRERHITVEVLGGFNRLEISRKNYINFWRYHRLFHAYRFERRPSCCRSTSLFPEPVLGGEGFPRLGTHNPRHLAFVRASRLMSTFGTGR